MAYSIMYLEKEEAVWNDTSGPVPITVFFVNFMDIIDLEVDWGHIP